MWYNLWYNSIPETCEWGINHPVLCKCVSAPTSCKEYHRGPRDQGNGSVVWREEFRFTCLFELQPFLARKSLPPNNLLPQNVCLQLSPQPNTTAKEFTSRSWCELERRVTWTQWIGDGNWWTTGSCQLCPVRLLPQKASCRWSTVIAQLPAEHNGAVTGHTDYQACLLVDHVKLGIVRSASMGGVWECDNGKSSEGHSAKKYKI